jgi:hypothetical protein
MDGNRPTQDFQEWLDSLDEAEVQAQVDAVQREFERLERRRELLLQALTLKRDWDALSSPGAAPSPVSEVSEVADEPLITEVPPLITEVPSLEDRVSESRPAASAEGRGHGSVLVGASRPRFGGHAFGAHTFGSSPLQSRTNDAVTAGS